MLYILQHKIEDIGLKFTICWKASLDDSEENAKLGNQ